METFSVKTVVAQNMLIKYSILICPGSVRAGVENAPPRHRLASFFISNKSFSPKLTEQSSDYTETPKKHKAAFIQNPVLWRSGDEVQSTGPIVFSSWTPLFDTRTG